MTMLALYYLLFILGLIFLVLAFAWIAPQEMVHRVYEFFNWLVKVSFVDPVRTIIFVRPLKKHADQAAAIIWLILAFVAGRYIIGTQPKITEIPGPYLPMIGIIYYLTVIYIIKFTLQFSHRAG